MKLKFAVIAAALIALSGCSNAKEQLGLTRSVPDEFTVVKRAPLEMPPDYSLRPPVPGAPRPQELGAQSQAREVVFGGAETQEKTAPTSAEAMLLQQTGGDQADPRIRAVVDQETATLEPKQKPVAERLLGWGKKKPDERPASVVDAQAEAARLKENEAEGKPVTAGETPVKED